MNDLESHRPGTVSFKSGRIEGDRLSPILEAVLRRRALSNIILPAVQIDALLLSPLARLVQLHRHLGNFQETRALFMVSVSRTI